MHLVVDHAGHEQATAGVDDLDVVMRVYRRGDPADSLAFDQDVGIACFAFIDKTRIGDKQSVHSPGFRGDVAPTVTKSHGGTTAGADRARRHGGLPAITGSSHFLCDRSPGMR